MKALLQAITIVSLLVSLSAAQNTPAEIQNLNVARSGNQLNIEVTLTSPVTPNVIVATGPDRLVLELPNTSAGSRQKRVAVNQDGVKAVRIGLNSADPPVTRVVVDLDQARLYRVETNGNTIVLAILPAPNASAERRNAPVPAASAPIWGRLHPQKRESLPAPPNDLNSGAEVIVPPKKFPPIQLPDGTAVPAPNSTTAANTKPSAKHPNFGSLQEGTVYPTSGAPGTGYVPAVSGARSGEVTTAAAGSSKTPPGTNQASGDASPATTITTAVVARMPKMDAPQANQTTARQPATAEPAPLVSGNASGRPSPSTGPAVSQAGAELAANKNIPSIVVTGPQNAPPTPPTSSPISANTALTTSNRATPTATTPNSTAANAQPASASKTSTTPVPVPPAAQQSASTSTPSAGSNPVSPAAATVNNPAPNTQVASAAKASTTPIAAPPTAQQSASTSAPSAASNSVSPAASTVSTPAPHTQVASAAKTSTTAITALPAAQPSASTSTPSAGSNPVSPGAATVSAPAVVANSATPSHAASPASNASNSSATTAAATGQRPVAASTSPSPITASSNASTTVAPALVAKAEPLPAAAAVTPQPGAAPVAIVNGTADPVDPNPALASRQPNAEIRMGFKVKYVAAGAAYLEGGKNAGLSEGMKLQVRDNLSGADAGTNEAYGPEVAGLEVLSVAETSTVAEISDSKRDVKAGDWAYLSSEDTQTLVAQRSLSPTRKYPAVISFTEGTDPLAEEAHAEVPRPPMPDINRARGRFGFDYSTIMSQGGGKSSSLGLSVMTDISRIGGTYWNMTGYWRGRLTSTSSGQQTQTLQDLINRTYHLGMFYDNPDSHFVAGFGRLFLPYATSLDTIDGGYAGYRVTKTATIGLFAGSTPDPTSWSYNPKQQIGGTFFNVQGGSFDFWRYSDTFGMGVEMLKWKINRPFVFGENSISFKRVFSIYSAVQADSPAANAAITAPGPGLSRSFTTFRVQPFSRIEFDVNHTYFRDVPTFDATLIGTGLLDKYLFQGFSAGTRIEVLKGAWVYTTLGRSNRSGDKAASLNQLYGLTLGHLPWTKIRTDVHYSKFSSSFGSGSYEAASVSRSFHDNFRWEVLAGKQAFVSSLSTNDSSHFVTGNLDLPIGSHYYLQSGFTWNRGGGQNYNQALFSFGYRFDTRKAGSR